MKRKLTGILVCMLSLVGCNNDVQKPETAKRVTVNTVMGPVTVQDAIKNDDQKAVEARVTGQGIDATLVITVTDDVNIHGVLASLTDNSGQLLYSIETTVNKATGATSWTEATAQDYLTFTLGGEGERVRETYDADGDVASFEYAQMSDEQKDRTFNYYQHGLDVSKLPPDMAEYARSADAFRTYYAPHANSSIHNNQSGTMLAQILTSPELPALVGGGGPAQISQNLQQWCTVFSTCASFSCRLWPTHPICGGCLAASMVCAIMMLACSWFGC